MTVGVVGGIRPDAVWRQGSPVNAAVTLTIHLRGADRFNAGLCCANPFAAVGQCDIQLIGTIPAVGGWVIHTVFGGIGCRVAILVEVIVEGAGEQDIAGNGRVIEGGGGLHGVVRRAGRDDQCRVICAGRVGFTVVARLRGLTIEPAGTQIAVCARGQNRVFDHQGVSKDITAIRNAFNAVIRGIVQLMVTLSQRNTCNVGVVLDNNIRFHIQRNRITQSIGIQIVGFGVVTIQNIIRIMLIGIVNGGVIDGQAKTIVLRMGRAVRINPISTRGGHAL